MINLPNWIPAQRPVRAAGLAVMALLLVFPAAVSANTNGPIAQTGGMTATLPLLGSSLEVAVTLDGVGNISGVALSPTGTLSATSTSKEVVKFSNTAGTARVTVRASGAKLTIKARAKLSDLVGAGTWSADVFGTGAKSTVAYTIGTSAGGAPTVAIGAVGTPTGVTSAAIAPKAKSGSKGSSATAGVTFSHDGFIKRLTISVGTKGSDGTASLRITLSGRDRQKLTGSLTDLAGPRTWAASLCDGTPVSVKYHVTSDGTIVYDGATGAPATQKTKPSDKAPDKGSWLMVRFTKTGVGVAVSLRPNGDGSYALKVMGRSGHCGDHRGLRHPMTGVKPAAKAGAGQAIATRDQSHRSRQRHPRSHH